MKDNSKSIYFYTCSNDILKEIAKLSNSKELLDLSIKYAENFYGTEAVDETWSLLSTTLLISETAAEISYKNLSKDFLDKIETIAKKEFSKYKNYLLDENNQKIRELEILIHDYDFTEEELRFYSNFGANSSVVNQHNKLDYQEFIFRIRNAIAHSNYEIIDEEYIRLYHFNDSTKTIDFNMLLNQRVVILMLDELNETKLKECSKLIQECNNRDNKIQFKQELVSDEEIINYLSTFKNLTQEQIQKVLKIAKEVEEFNVLDKSGGIEDNFKRFTILYDIIYKKYIDPFSYLIALSNITRESINISKRPDDFLWNRLGNYQHFELINEISTEELLDKKIKLLLIAFLNNIILYSFNINDDGKNINYDNLDFSKMKIDKKIIEEFVEKTYKSIESKYSQNITQENKLTKLAKKIAKNKEILKNNSNINNIYFLETLPNKIDISEKEYNEKYQEQQERKKQELIERYKTLFEISDLKENINYTSNISNFIFRHLRNSLAHGYIEIPNGLNLENLGDTIICLEDYDKDKEPKELTFRGFIKVNDLIEVVTNKKFIDEMFENYHKSKTLKK